MRRPANSPLSPQAAHALDLFFTVEAPFDDSWTLRRDRETQFARLYALPDAALASMGLTREGLPRWLYRDIFRN